MCGEEEREEHQVYVEGASPMPHTPGRLAERDREGSSGRPAWALKAQGNRHRSELSHPGETELSLSSLETGVKDVEVLQVGFSKSSAELRYTC